MVQRNSGKWSLKIIHICMYFFSHIFLENNICMFSFFCWICSDSKKINHVNDICMFFRPERSSSISDSVRLSVVLSICLSVFSIVFLYMAIVYIIHNGSLPFLVNEPFPSWKKIYAIIILPQQTETFGLPLLYAQGGRGQGLGGYDSCRPSRCFHTRRISGRLWGGDGQRGGREGGEGGEVQEGGIGRRWSTRPLHTTTGDCPF